MEKIVYFELNNWAAGNDYPNAEPFLSWMEDDCKIPFANDGWAKENRICVAATIIDMSQNFCITAPRDWVEKNCPELLTKYTEFIRCPDEDGSVYGNWDTLFLKYEENNFGVTWVKDVCI